MRKNEKWAVYEEFEGVEDSIFNITAGIFVYGNQERLLANAENKEQLRKMLKKHWKPPSV